MSQKLLINKDQLSIARNISLFSGLTEEEKDILLKGGDIYFYPRRKYLFRQEDPIKYLYIVCEGAVREFRDTLDGHEITVNIHRTGEVFCKTEMFLQNGLHHTSAAAVDDVHVLELPIEQFKENFQKYSTVSKRLLFSLAQFAFMKQIEVEQQVTMTSVQMIASFLHQLCVSHGLDPRGFTLPYSKSLIASRLGMEIETFSRALPKLKEHGIIVKGKTISFLDLQEYDVHEYRSVVKFNPAHKSIRKIA